MESSNINQDQTVPVVAPAGSRRRHVGRWLTLFAIVLIAGVVSALMLLRSDNSNTVQAAAAGTVQINSRSFEPQTIKIKKGQAVTWVNKDSRPHHIMADPYPTGDSLKSLNSVEPLAQDESYTATFEQAGTYTYHDQLNPARLKGTVIVE